MAFLKRKRKTNELYLVKAEIMPSCNIGTWREAQYVTQYFLAKQKENKYYELFSGEPLEIKEEGSKNNLSDVPYIEEVNPLSQYFYNDELTDSELFSYIIKTNAVNQLKMSKE